MNSYNLLDKPWLPVRWLGDAPPSAVGLRDALIRAHDIVELATDNPLETIAINRLLAALMASVFPEIAEEGAWMNVWQHGSFDVGRCTDYLNQYAGHFDLLSPTRPFFGHPQTDTKEVSPVSRLQHATASGNNAVLFSHDLDSATRPLTLAEAARALVCTQAAALGGGVAQPFNLSHGPLVGGAFFWLRGQVQETSSLFRALLLNLAPTDEVWGKDKPLAATWEPDKPPAAQKRDVGGIRELFTFQSRRLQLVVDSQEQVVGVRYNQGSKVEKRLFDDPNLAYKSGKEGLYPLRFSVNRALWQESAAYMMNPKSGVGHAPRIVEWLTRQKLRELGLGRDAAFAVDVFGLVNDQAKVELWRHERVTIYPNIVADTARWKTLNALLDDPSPTTDDARKRAGRLREATRAFAIRARLSKPWGTRLGDVERADRDAFVQMIDAESRYWLALGSQFDQFLTQIATLPTDTDDLFDLQKRWQQTIKKTAADALRSALKPLAQDARTWRALAEAETVLSFGTLYPKPRKSEPA